MSDRARSAEERFQYPSNERIKFLLDQSITLGLDLPNEEPVGLKIEKLIKYLIRGQLITDQILPTSVEIAKLDAEVDQKRLEVGFQSYLELLREFVKGFLKIVTEKAGVTFPAEMNTQVEAAFADPVEKDWSPILNQLLEAFHARYPSADASISPNGVLSIETPTHSIGVGQAGNEGLSVDFMKKNKPSQLGGHTSPFDDTSISKNLEEGSVEVARYVKFLVQEITQVLHVKLFVNPSDQRRASEYRKLIRRFGLTHSTQLNPPQRRS